jgi:hypothetical protein
MKLFNLNTQTLLRGRHYAELDEAMHSIQKDCFFAEKAHRNDGFHTIVIATKEAIYYKTAYMAQSIIAVPNKQFLETNHTSAIWAKSA